jgi:regulator of sigma E protease
VTNFANPPVAGPVGIVDAVGSIRQSEQSALYLLYFTALLSANIALINILPIPPFDGGQILIAGLRSISRGRLGVTFNRRAIAVGYAFLLALVVWVTIHDIGRLAA